MYVSRLRRSVGPARVRVLAAAFAALALVACQPELGRASAPNPNDIDVFALSATGFSMSQWNYTTGQWTDLGAPKATSLVTGDAGVFDWYENTGDIYEYGGAPGKWTAIGGPGNYFVESGSHLFGTSPNDDYVAEWNGPGKGWTEIGGATGEIWGGKFGLVATNPTSNYAYLYGGTPGQWTYIGPASQFVVTDNAIYRQDPQGTGFVDEWVGPGDNWEEVGGPCDEVYGGGAGVFCTFMYDSDNIYVYNGTPNSWTRIGGPGATFAVSGSYLFGLGPEPAHAYVAVWNEQPGNWSIIGGSESYIYAGD